MRQRRALAAMLLLAVAGLAPGTATAQTEGVRINDVDHSRYPDVEVVVTVPAAFEDISLPKEAFTIAEDGEPQPRPTLGNAPGTDEPQAPPRVVLAIDVSGSMQHAIGQALEAADGFVRSLPPGSEVAVVTFGDDVDMTVDLTPNVEAVRAALRDVEVDPTAETALYDGVRRAANLLPPADGAPGSIVLLSDGGDTASASAREDAVRTVRQRDTVLWAVELVSGDLNREALADLAGDSERVLAAQHASELEGIYRGLASDLSRRYVLRYESTSSGETDVRVTVDHLGLTASSTVTVDFDDAPPPAGTVQAPVATPDVHTVAVHPLGTRTAYAVGLTAISIGSMLIWLLVLAPRSRTRERLLVDQGQRARPRLSSIAEWTTDVAERSLRGRRLGRGLDRYLEGAGLDLRPGEVAVIVVSAMVVVFAVGTVAAGPLLGLLLAVMPPLAARLVLSIRRDRRQAAFADQLTDVLQLISGSLRAGYGLLQGIDAVARDGEEPSSSEFRRILIEHRLGRDMNDAMLSCAARMDNDDFSWVVQAISIHRDVGGDLARVLDNVVDTVRARGDVHRQVRALSAEGRMSAYVLTGLPLLMLVGLQVINPDYLRELFVRPVGWVMLAAAAVLMLGGMVWIRKLIHIRY